MQSTDSTRQKQSSVGTQRLSAVSSGESLVLPTSTILGSGAAHSSHGPAAIAPGAGLRSRAGQLHGLGVPGALSPVPEHPQNRTGASGHTVAAGLGGRTLTTAHADWEIPLVDGQELAVSRFPHGMMRRVC